MMEKALVICFMALFSPFALAQEQGNYAEAASTFVDYYNAADYAMIFDAFNEDMQKALPRQQTLTFFRQTSNLMGNIKHMAFSRIDRGAHIYNAEFDYAIAEIVLSLSTNNMINGLAIRPVADDEIPVLERNTTRMMLPFKEEWFVFWGGTTVEQNYHVEYPDQKYAYDILMVKEGASYTGDSTKNESYFVFGKEILAPCDAKVVKVIDGVEDNIPGQLNPSQLTGNTVVLETDKKEFVLLAHLKKESIMVEEGQEVRKGEILGLCGNSGNSSEPHLHLSLQNHKDMLRSKGAKLYFDHIMVNGELKTDYLPVKEDFIRNIE